jgi:hypothetical protein
MTLTSMLEYLKEVQHESQTLQHLQQQTWLLGERYEELISFKTFLMLMLSKSNSIFDPRKETLYQSMDHPMTDYFICSSHNTYLKGD